MTVSPEIVDCDRHVAVHDYRDLFPYMSSGWSRHFDREEFLGSIHLTSTHVRVSDCFDAAPSPASFAQSAPGTRSMLVPHQGLAVNGWSDGPAAQAFIAAINRYGEAHWEGRDRLPVLLVSPFDTDWSALEIRNRSALSHYSAVALPLTAKLLGARQWDRIYEACVDTGLPIYVHFSGVEGRYLGAAPLSGGIHRTAAARFALMPHLAESNVASLVFEGVLERFPALDFIFAGFGFSWLPSLLWRLDREWRTFRHDVPWVKRPPSEYVLESMWFSSWPIRESDNLEEERTGISATMKGRLVYGSHSPFDGDTPEDVEAALGLDEGRELLQRGKEVLAQGATSGGGR